MGDGKTDTAEKGKQLNALWPRFQQVLSSSKYLTRPDRERIAGSVQERLRSQLDALRSGGPFETRSWGQAEVAAQSPAHFDLADVPDYVDLSDPESRRVGLEALSGTPAF